MAAPVGSGTAAFRVSAPETLFRINSGVNPLFTCDVSGDGRFLTLDREKAESPIVLVLNRQPRLSRR
jgi:hypothetical protein